MDAAQLRLQLPFLSRIRIPLKLKLSLLILALLIPTVVLLSVSLLYRADRSLTAEMRKRGLTIAQHLASAAKNPLITNDELTLNLLVKDAMQDADVTYVIITDHDGTVRAHTDVSQIGKRLVRPADLAPAHEEPLVQTYTAPGVGRILDLTVPLTFRKISVGAVFVGFSQKAIEQALANARTQTVAISFIMVVLGVGGALALAELLARPIQRLVDGTRTIAAGDFTVSLAIPSRDEIGTLTEAFNLMAKNLREKEMIKRAFARYVAREVVEELLKDPERLILTGERREVTVLFCDMRGFTSLSERMSPEEVVMLLNDFYELMIEATFRHEGTLDKFLGDAVMSVFGAPVPHVDHSIRAIRTALAMRKGIERLSARRIHGGKDPVSVGIGVSTGEAVAGTVGTQARMEYTVIGDSVNLAARLESRAKPMQILMTARTYKEVQPYVEARPLGAVKVKGKEEGVAVYEVLRLK